MNELLTGFEKQARLAGVSVVALMSGGKLLMGKRRDNSRWTQPGGHLEGKEDPEIGAVREVKEETGIDISSDDLEHLKTEVVTKPDGTKLKIHAYKAELGDKPKTSMKNDPDGEVYRWNWVTEDQIHSPEIWEHLHVKPEENVVLKALGMVKAAAFLTFDKIVVKAPKHPDSWYKKDQIAKGMKVEEEHSESKPLRKNITKNHLDEDETYYNDSMFKKDLEKGASMHPFFSGFEKAAATAQTRGADMAIQAVTSGAKSIGGRVRQAWQNFKRPIHDAVRAPHKENLGAMRTQIQSATPAKPNIPGGKKRGPKYEQRMNNYVQNTNAYNTQRQAAIRAAGPSSRAGRRGAVSPERIQAAEQRAATAQAARTQNAQPAAASQPASTDRWGEAGKWIGGGIIGATGANLMMNRNQ